MKNVVITGASSGIGKATCKTFLMQGYRVFGSVRKSDDAEKLSLELKENFYPLILDVTDYKSVEKAKLIVQKFTKNNRLDLLINNAGIAILGPLEHINMNEFQKQIDVNLKGNLICTRVFLPLLGTNANLKGNPGSIINISSALGGKIGAPYYGGYCASKHALEGMSETLRRELRLFGIKVVIVSPGAVSTPIWGKVDYNDQSQKYKDTKYYFSFKKNLDLLSKLNRTKLTAKKVSKLIYKISLLKRPKRKYYIVNNFTLNFILLAPKFVVDFCFKKYFSLTK